MAIGKKAAPKISEEQIDRIISGGLDKPATASTPAPAPALSIVQGAKSHNLRFPEDGVLFARLEKASQSSAVKLPRNTFILQAIAEKLERLDL